MDSWRKRDAMRQAHRRQANESLEDAGRHVTARRRRITFLCECGDAACAEPVSLSLSEYETVRAHANHFVIMINHENPEVESVVTESARFAVVETLAGEASKVALRTDPRALHHDGDLRGMAHG